MPAARARSRALGARAGTRVLGQPRARLRLPRPCARPAVFVTAMTIGRLAASRPHRRSAAPARRRQGGEHDCAQRHDDAAVPEQPAEQCRARRRAREPQQGAQQAGPDRQPAHLDRRGQRVAHPEEHEPGRARADLDALTDVEDGAVTGEDVVDDSHVDEAVVGDPAPLPAEDGHDQQGHGAQQRARQATTVSCRPRAGGRVGAAPGRYPWTEVSATEYHVLSWVAAGSPRER